MIQVVIPTLFSLFFHDFVSSIHLWQESPCNVYLLYLGLEAKIAERVDFEIQKYHFHGFSTKSVPT